MTPEMRAEAAFLRFHLRVGARLALRILAPALAAILFLFYVLRPEFVLALARALYLEGSLVESGLAGTLLLLAMARAVVPRIAAGQAGWARSLPAGGRVLRNLEVLSSVVAEAPLLVVLGALAWAVAGPEPARIAAHLAGLLVGAAAANVLCLKSRVSLMNRFLPAAACFLSLSGQGLPLMAAAGCLTLAMAAPGNVPIMRRRSRRRRPLPASHFFVGVSLRALGVRTVLIYVPPLFILGACRLFLVNNAFSGRAAFSLSLFGLTLGLAASIASAAHALAARRPVWPWLRSLPRSAAARIGSDALFLGLAALPVLFGLALLGRQAVEAMFLAGPLVWLALRGAGAMRGAADRAFGVLGRLVIEGTILSMIVAVVPWGAWVLGAVAPSAFVWARNAERRLKPTLWAARHHLSAGDPLSWSES